MQDEIKAGPPVRPDLKVPIDQAGPETISCTMFSETPEERWRRLLAKAGEEKDPIKIRALIEGLNSLFEGRLDRVFERDEQSYGENPTADKAG